MATDKLRDLKVKLDMDVIIKADKDCLSCNAFTIATFSSLLLVADRSAKLLFHFWLAWKRFGSNFC